MNGTEAPCRACEPVEVPLKDVERELDRQLKSAQGMAQGPVRRARMSNLIIYCDAEAQAEAIAPEIPAITAVHPARVLLLIHEPGRPSADLTAIAHARVHSEGGDLRSFSEQVTLRAPGSSGRHLPFAVRHLLIGDLPTNLWWASNQPPALAGPLLFELSDSADQALYDSFGWPDPARGLAATASWIERFERSPGPGVRRYRVASDLSWRRLKMWRRLLGQALDPATAPGALESITELKIEHGPHAVMSAWFLASWLISRLGWRVGPARVRRETEFDWRLDPPKGPPKTLRIIRLADRPSGIQHVRVSCTIGGEPGALSLNPEDDGRRLSITPEDGAQVAPRTVTIQPQPLAELVGRQLSDRDRDPIFCDAMTAAQAMAQSVLAT